MIAEAVGQPCVIEPLGADTARLLRQLMPIGEANGSAWKKTSLESVSRT